MYGLFALEMVAGRAVYVATIDNGGTIRVLGGGSHDDNLPSSAHIRFCCDATGLSQVCRGDNCEKKIDVSRCRHALHQACMSWLKFYAWKDSGPSPDAGGSRILSSAHAPWQKPVDKSSASFGAILVAVAFGCTMLVVGLLIMHLLNSSPPNFPDMPSEHRYEHRLLEVGADTWKVCTD